MNRSIALGKIAEHRDQVVFAITSQTHYGQHFTTNESPCQNIFTASNGIRLASVVIPTMYERERTVYVRGSDASKDDRVLVASKEFFEEIKEAFSEYNETHLTSA